MALLPSGLPDHVDDAEDLARFLVQSKWFKNGMAKPVAFLPYPKDRETSVSRHGQEPADRLWAIGLHVAGDRTLYGVALFKASVVRKEGLEVYPDEPPDFHAVIRDWPWNDSNMTLQKDMQLAMAQVLASEAKLVIKK